jgi:hypothetical protein
VTSRPYLCATKGDGRVTRMVPWIIVVPLLAVAAFLAFGPPSTARSLAIFGTLVAAAVAALPALAGLSKTNRAWVHRTISVGADRLVAERPGFGTEDFPYGMITRISTTPLSVGIQIPPVMHLITEFIGRDGARIPELSIHHYSYRYGLHTSESNHDGPALLQALADSPLGERLDLASRALAEVVLGAADEGGDGLSDKTIAAMRAGRVHAARRSAVKDGKRSGRVSHALVRLECVLVNRGEQVARDAVEQRPRDPMPRYYLAHACLHSAEGPESSRPGVIAHREDMRAQAKALLEGLLSEPDFAEAARRDLEAMLPPVRRSGPRGPLSLGLPEPHEERRPHEE